ncbi:hypothetical protein EKM05_14180 [Flavobacterium sp. GSP27]|uniref:hypothetical protein n=1 Tax=unclassified Flavobacterium TaxID=196869 RepID=UPI000F82A1AF|nr:MULTISPECIES: hypothetical protein [unclassified Flavobacterium]RTY84646.1 hypothetical protein EKL99_01225 [Flavobacterium sp. ZB4P23]RTY91980.1 hypothetical protein EKM01_04990 [Flavobacterium sp. RSP46]RTZ04676.1 hypothetical protein EKM05_14180 [Flavobacterium sp. GSP27]
MSKTVIILAVILATCNSYSQTEKDNYISFSGGLDLRNAIIGSDPTNDKSAINYNLQFSMVDRNVEVSVGYESFNKIQFDKYFIGLGYHFPLYLYAFQRSIKTTFIPSIEPTLINRWGTWGGGISFNEPSSHLSIGTNLSFRWDVNDKFAFEYSLNALPRTDLKAKYGDLSAKNRLSIDGVGIIGSSFVKFIWKLPT